MQFGTLVGQPAGAVLPLADAAVAARPARTLWPLPAAAAWVLAWLAYIALERVAAPDWLSVGTATACGVSLSVLGSTPWRRGIVAGGFPLSLVATGAAAGAPGWAWLLPLLLLALVYPLNAWRDAPFFPTPARALDGLERLAPLPAGARVLDAGCGLGHGLAALRLAYPRAHIDGVEWSWPLALAARLRARIGSVRCAIDQGDMWERDWSGCSLVYLFQRPESLPRAVAKAGRELSPGAWLVSLEFEAAQLLPQAVARCADGRALWLYRAPFVTAATSADDKALNLTARSAEKKA